MITEINLNTYYLSKTEIDIAFGTTGKQGASVIKNAIDQKADKTDGVAQVTDANSDDYAGIGSMSSGATQQTINSKINTALSNKANIDHNTPISKSNKFGHTKLSDTYSDYVGSSNDGIGASQSSVYTLYEKLSNKNYTLKNGHGHGNIYYDGSLDPSADIVSFSESNVPLVVDASHGNMIGIGQVPTKSIKDDTAYNNLQTSENATQHTINDSINNSIGSITTELDNKENKNNKTSSITENNEYETQYPNVKAVMDYAQPKGNYLPKASSDTGFVKSDGTIKGFGNSAGTVAEGNHTHPTVKTVDIGTGGYLKVNESIRLAEFYLNESFSFGSSDTINISTSIAQIPAGYRPLNNCVLSTGNPLITILIYSSNGKISATKSNYAAATNYTVHSTGHWFY